MYIGPSACLYYVLYVQRTTYYLYLYYHARSLTYCHAYTTKPTAIAADWRLAEEQSESTWHES